MSLPHRIWLLIRPFYRFFNRHCRGIPERLHWKFYQKRRCLGADALKASLAWNGTLRFYRDEASTPFYLDNPSGKRAYVGVMENVRLFGTYRLAITRQGKLIEDNSAAEIGCIRKASQHALFTRMIPGMPCRVERAVINLVTPWSQWYYHWMLECLTRLCPYAKACELYGEDFTILIPSESPPFIWESLRLLGLGPRICHTASPVVRAEKLLISSYRRRRGQIAGSICKWLREAFFRALEIELPSGKPPRDIYITRKHAEKRRVANEAELEGFLAARGFQTVALEQLSLAEQIRLFSEARTVVAPHGGGLTNMIFSSRQDFQLIELNRQQAPNRCYKNLASVNGLAHSTLNCREEGVDLAVDLGQLEKVIA